MIFFIIGAIVVFVGISFSHVSKAQNQTITFRYGCALVSVGLALSLFFPWLVAQESGKVDVERMQYLSNTFLIMASIGANLIAASLFMKASDKKANQQCSSCGNAFTNPEPKPAIGDESKSTEKSVESKLADSQEKTQSNHPQQN